MGIPYYFKHIVNKFPNLITEPKSNCSRLYIDFNCIIHQCAAELDESTYRTLEDFHDNIIKSSLSYITKLSKVCNPSSLLFIAVDGVCPRAKMNQQRKRRYMSTWEKKFIGKETLWDSNVVTPGTYFMRKLDDALVTYTLERNDIKVICSPSSEMGEGEHKIVHHIRNHPVSNSSDIMIYGLDADLIILSMILYVENQKNKLFLLRENNMFNVKNANGSKYFCTFDIGHFVHRLDETFCSDSELSLNEKVYDLSILTSFIGNDFLPPLTFLKIRHGGLNILEKTYLNTYNQCQEKLVLDDKKINWNFVNLLLKNLSNIEDEKFNEVNNYYYSPKNLITKHDKCSKEYIIDNYVELNKFKHRIDSTKNDWHSKYNELLFSKYVVSNNNDIVNTACSKYIDGIEWITEYYLIGKDAQYSRWYYPYLYSPTIHDLANYLTLKKSISNYCSKKLFEHHIYTPEMQLLIVLPSDSIRKIIPKYSNIIDNLEYGCADMYPEEFEIVTYLKNYLWECLPVLPEISEEQLKKVLH